MTEIRCPYCLGDGKDHSHKLIPFDKCPSCDGTGLSRMSYDQKVRATTVNGDILARSPHLRVVSSGTYRNGKLEGILVEWDNPLYVERLALDREGKLYPKGYWED